MGTICIKPNVIHLQMQDDDVQTKMAWQEQQVVKFSSEETPATMYEMANFDLLVLYNPPHWTATTRQIVGGSTVYGKQQIQDWLRDAHGGRFPFLAQDGENGTQNYSTGIAQRPYLHNRC